MEEGQEAMEAERQEKAANKRNAGIRIKENR